MPEDPNTLFEEAKCFRCNSDASLSDLLKLALLQRIAEAGGGGGGGTPGGAASSVQFNNAGAFGGFGSFNSGTSVLTIPGDLLFNTDNADDIGASGASRPRTGYFGTSVVTPLATILAAANAEAINVSGYSLTGANAQSMLALSGTWNTSGNPTGIRLSVTDTASGASAMLMNLLGGAAGATSMFSVSKDGRGVLANRLTTPIIVAPAQLTLAATTSISLEAGGGAQWQITSTGFIAVTDNADDIGASGATRPRNIFIAGSITTGATTLHTTSAALTDGAGAGAGTITNAPSAGNPTKWISIIDNGTTRWLPSWT